MRWQTTSAEPEGFARVRQRLEQWRQLPRSEGRRRIPERLWRAAVELAGQHGTYRTARALGLNYQNLKDRLGSAGQREGAAHEERGGAFVELTPAFVGGPECVVDLEDGTGARMRIQLRGAAAPDLAALASGFWRSEK